MTMLIAKVAKGDAITKHRASATGYRGPCTLHLCTRNTTAVFMAAVLLVGASACRKKDFTPSKMVGPLYSYQSLETVERKLDLRPGDWDVLEDRKPLSSDTRPMFRIFTFSKKDFPLLDTPGQNLIMTFYNDRLMTVQFYPYDLGAFKSALGADGVTLSAAGDAHVPPSTRVWVGKDAAGKYYVGFMDKALEGEHDAWVAKYSH